MSRNAYDSLGIFVAGLICGLLIGLLAGCGGQQGHPRAHALTFTQPHAPACHPRNPPSLGECVGQHFGVRRGSGHPTARSGKACADWSQWQGYSPPTAGLSCVVVQSNYGLHVEPSVWSQARDVLGHHLTCAVYSFMEGASGSAEADLAVSIARRTGCRAGVFADAEIGAAYSHACAYVSRVRSHKLLAGLYTAPGLWPGGRCEGYLWPAEWGTSAYPFAGYSASAIVLQQTCGTCFRGGTETDLDVDYGLIALARTETPAHRKARLHAELGDANGRLGRERAFLNHHRCRKAKRPRPRPLPRTRAEKRLCAVVKANGNATHGRIDRLHREGAR